MIYQTASRQQFSIPMISLKSHLGIGLYTPEDAAFYARVRTRLLKRWLFGDKQGEPVLRPQIRELTADDRIVTFHDLIQALAIRAIRTEFNVPLQKIRSAVDYIKDTFGIEYPFAKRHTTFLFSDRMRKGHGEIVIRLPGLDDENFDRYVQASGKKSGNLVMKEVVELYTDDLSFDVDGFAHEWRPMSQNGDSVLLSPARRFGEPVIESTGYTVETLHEASLAEGGIANAAAAFGVSESAVKLACKFYDHLKNDAA